MREVTPQRLVVRSFVIYNYSLLFPVTVPDGVDIGKTGESSATGTSQVGQSGQTGVSNPVNPMNPVNPSNPTNPGFPNNQQLNPVNPNVQQNPCGIDNWIQTPFGSCLKIFHNGRTSPLTWYAAQEECRQYGGDLYMADNPQKNHWLKSLIWARKYIVCFPPQMSVIGVRRAHESCFPTGNFSKISVLGSLPEIVYRYLQRITLYQFRLDKLQ